MQHAQTQARTHAITQGLHYATFHIMYLCIYICENVFTCILDFFKFNVCVSLHTVYTLNYIAMSNTNICEVTKTFAMTDMKKMAIDYAPVSEVIRKQRCLIIIGF